MLTLIILASLLSITKENCLDCHDDILNKKYIHDAAKELCENCHTSHESKNNNPYNLTSFPNELCFECHSRDSVVGHPVYKHPIELEHDIFYPDKKFTCLSCHNPHSSDMPKLFRYNYLKPPYLRHTCAICHWENYGIPKPPLPPWNY